MVISRRQFLALAALVVTGCASSRSSTSPTAPATTGQPAATPSPTTTTPSSTTTTTTTASTTTTTTLATTTTVPPDPALAYTEVGPHHVGVTTLTLPTGNLVEVWYPTDTVTGTVSYDVRDLLPPAIKELLSGDLPATYTYAATRDAPPSSGPFPLVLFSHGFTGFRMQSTFLTAHLASWGMAVAAPDHPARDMFHVLGGPQAPGGPTDPVADLLGTLELVTNEGRLSPALDAAHVAAVGHSAGGPTVTAAAADPRIAGYVSMASGAFGEAVEPDKPSFFLAGSVDSVVSLETVTRPAFAAAPSPSLLWTIDGVGHNGFDDVCTFGNGKGLIGLAEASGLGSMLDAQPQLRRLGQDGCLPPAAPVDSTFPIIRHAVTAWLRHLFGVDPAPVGLGPDAAGSYPVGVTVEQH